MEWINSLEVIYKGGYVIGLFCLHVSWVCYFIAHILEILNKKEKM